MYPESREKLEQSILGSMLIDDESRTAGLATCTRELFAEARHRTMFDAIQANQKHGRPADAIAVGTELTQAEEQFSWGDIARLMDLAAPWYLESHVRALSRLANIGLFGQSLDTAKDLLATERPETVLEEHRKVVDELMFIEESPWAAIGGIDLAAHSIDGLRGLSTGYRDLNGPLGGLLPGDLIIVASRTGVGKSSLAAGMAMRIAVVAGHSVLIASMEMAKEAVAKRITDNAGVLGYAVDWNQQRIFIDERSAISTGELSASAYRLKATKGLDCLFVDYLQLARPVAETRNRVEHVSAVARELKNLAMGLKIPVVAMSQLSRAADHSGGPPVLSDLRESGEIEQAADAVIFLHRPEARDYTNPTQETEVILAKNRRGPTAAFRLLFNFPKTTFLDM